jgi:hypothetical protein
LNQGFKVFQCGTDRAERLRQQLQELASITIVSMRQSTRDGN